jgi:carbamoyl-phosphate synthase large subunit
MQLKAGFTNRSVQEIQMTKTVSDSCESLSILFTCIGRRVSLLNSFRQAARKLRLEARFCGTDTEQLSAAYQLCDEGFLVKPVGHAGYLKHLLRIVRQRNIDLLVPTVDLDLKLLALNKASFARYGCYVLISDPQVVEVCQDKLKTYHFLVRNNFDTPATVTLRQALAARRLTFPCFLKQRDGSAGKGNAIARNRRELRFYGKRIHNCLVQEFVEGTEYTCDVFVDFDMKAACVVPRRRIEVRSGEVSKGQVVKDRRIMAQCARLAETLGAGPGVITLQLFVSRRGKIKFIEINPRFGGGVPLSIKAGADFPKWILQRLVGREPSIKFDGFEDGLVMLRYDSEVWVHKTR